MTIASEIYTALTGYSALTALVSDKIRPVEADRDDEPPYVVYEVVSAVPENGLDGHLGKTQYRVQIDAWATTHQAAAEIRDAIRDAMEAANDAGTLRNRWEDERDQPREMATRLFGIAIDFMVWIAT